MIALNQTISKELLASIRQRRSAGESLGKLAKEIGLPWQRLWTLLYPWATPSTLPVLRPNASAGSLIEKYRPSEPRHDLGPGCRG